MQRSDIALLLRDLLARLFQGFWHCGWWWKTAKSFLCLVKLHDIRKFKLLIFRSDLPAYRKFNRTPLLAAVNLLWTNENPLCHPCPGLPGKTDQRVLCLGSRDLDGGGKVGQDNLDIHSFYPHQPHPTSAPTNNNSSSTLD